MSFTSWLRNLQSALYRSPVDRNHRGRSLRAATHRPQLEVLEDRCLLSFSPAVSYPAGANPQAVLTADFNGDGKIDLAVANYDTSTVSVLPGNGDGTFGAAVNSPTGGGPLSLAVGDFDGDGNLDLVTVSSADVSVLLGNGNGTFQAPTSIGLVSSPTSVAVGDFNADGKMDLGVTSSVYYPGFSRGSNGYGGGNSGGNYGSYGGNYGGYGHYGNHGGTGVNCYGGYGGGSNGYGGNGYGGYGSYWYPGHFESCANVLLGNGDGSFALTGAQSLGTLLSRSVAVGDFNKDGNLDLVATANPYSAGFYTGYGGGPYGTSYYGGWTLGVRACVLLGNGDGTLQAATGVDVGSSPTSVAAGDVNGDGNLDLVTANGWGNDVCVVLGDGLGAFGAPQSFGAGSYPVSVVLGDFTGDGRIDIATANSDSNDLSVLRGLGNGSFAAPLHFAVGLYPYGLATGDFNGDAFPDVAVANAGSNDVSVLLNTNEWNYFRVTASPSQTTAGEEFTLTVTALDNAGNVLTGYAGTVHFSSTDTQAILPADYTFTAGGTHSFTITLKTAGTQSLTVTDTASSDFAGSQTGIVVNAAAANTFVVSGFPSSQFNSQPFVVAYSGGLTTATGTTFGPDGNFYVSSYSTNQVLRYRPDGVFLDVFVNSGNGLVNPGFIAFRGNYLYVSSIGSGGVFRYNATTGAFVDQFVSGANLPENFDWGPDGNLYVADRGTNSVKRYDATTGAFLNNFVTTNLNGPLGLKFHTDGKLYVSNYLDNTVTRYSGGTGAFIDTFVSAGSGGLIGPHQVLFAADGSLYVVSAETNQVLRYDGASGMFLGVAAAGGGLNRPTSLLFGSDGTLYVAGFYSNNVIRYFGLGSRVGAADFFSVTARDAFGNLATSYTGTVHFTSTDPLASLPGDYTFIAADVGTHTFSSTFWTAGMQSRTATDTAGVTGTQANIEVTTASRFVVSGFPSSATAGTAATFTVSAMDIYGNIVPGYRGTVHFSSSDAAATLPGDYAFTSGVLTFTATLRTAGTQSLTVTDTVSPSITGSQVGIRVIPLASVTGPLVGFCNQTITFTLGASGMPAGTVFSYRIDWNGDGNVDQTVSGINGATIDHMYAVTATYNIGVTATVHIGTQDYISTLVYKSVFVSVGSASVQTDPADATKKALVVEGTANAELLLLSPGTGNSIVVSINGFSVGTFTAPGGVPFGHLLVFGYGGDDILRFSGGMTVPAFLFGGDGNDTLDAISSTANNVLVGGAGGDVIAGGSGRDLLIGGLGPDSLLGGSGDDILIGGYTDYDANLTALCALMKEWSRIDADYNTRVKHLNGNLGGGLNGSYFLKAGTVHTVNDDAANDNMWGEAGLDWFFKKNAPPNITKDKVNDKSTGEVVTTIS